MRRTQSWAIAGIEPTIADLLLDVVGQTMMRADGVSAADVLTLVEQLQRDKILSAKLDRRSERWPVYGDDTDLEIYNTLAQTDG
jgi:hypothetical protein